MGGRRCVMTTIPHETAPAVPNWATRILVPEMWATLAIVVIWLAVLFAAVYGTDIVSTTYLGDRTTLPAVVPIALFAFLATWVVARYGYGRDREARQG
jgi:uncharacterized integral membrane protein